MPLILGYIGLQPKLVWSKSNDTLCQTVVPWPLRGRGILGVEKHWRKTNHRGPLSTRILQFASVNDLTHL